MTTPTSNGKRHVTARILCCFSSLLAIACNSQSLAPASAPVPSCSNPIPLDVSAASVGTEMQTYLISLKSQVSVDKFAERVAAKDVVIVAKMSAVRVIAVNASLEAVARLRCDVDVQSISMDEPTTIAK